MPETWSSWLSREAFAHQWAFKLVDSYVEKKAHGLEVYLKKFVILAAFGCVWILEWRLCLFNSHGSHLCLQLGLTEKNILIHDFDLVASDPSDANTNSTTVFSDDTDEKSQRSALPKTSMSNQRENEVSMNLSFMDS